MQKAMVLCGLVVVFCMGSTQGQIRSSDEELPLLASAYTESPHQWILYQYIDSEWEIVNAEGFNAGRLSPDGKNLAFLRVPPFLQALINGGQNWLSGSASDIAVMNLRDESWHEITVQPETITTNDNGYSGGIKRSLPVWSPDGHALAWTEQDYPALSSARLVVYDLDSDTSRILDDALPGMTLSSDGLPDRLNWGQPGIVVFANDPIDNAETLRFYNVATGTMQVIRMPDDGMEWYPIAGPLWVTNTQANTGEELVVVQASRDIWYQVDPVTGTAGDLNSQLEMISADNPAESLRLVWDPHTDANSPAWQMVTADGIILSTWAESLQFDSGMTLTRLVLAPSGQAAAYLENGVLFVWRDGTAVEIAAPEGVQLSTLLWGPVQWQFGAPSYSKPQG